VKRTTAEPKNPTLDQVNRQISVTTVFVSDHPLARAEFTSISHTSQPFCLAEIYRCIARLSSPCLTIALLLSTGLVSVRKSRDDPSARLGSALGRWNPVEETSLCIYSCLRTYRSELFNRVLSNQPITGLTAREVGIRL
jgi:hypothetical protein